MWSARTTDVQRSDVCGTAMRMRDEQLQQIAEMALQAKVGILHDIGVSP